MAEENVRPTGVRVEYSIEMTVNTGNFQNMKPGFKISADVPDDVHPGIILNKLEALAEHRLELKVNEIQAEAAG